MSSTFWHSRRSACSQQVVLAAEVLEGADHDLCGFVRFKNIGEVLDAFAAVHGAEVRHVGDVVDQFAHVVLDGPVDHRPVRPFVTEDLRQARDVLLGWRRIALRVVPHEKQLVLLAGRPSAGAGLGRNRLGIGNVLADAVAAPFPAVEFAHDGVAADGADAEVSAHVRAIGVEDAHLAVFALEG